MGAGDGSQFGLGQQATPEQIADQKAKDDAFAASPQGQAQARATAMGASPSDMALDPSGHGLLFSNTAGALGLGYSDPNAYGYGNFTPGAQSAMKQYNSMGGQMLQNNAPTLRRSSADFSGGNGMGETGNVNYQNQMQTRGQQGAYINSLQNDVNGGTPSLAQMQLKQGADQSLQNQAAMAASGGPTNNFLAQRNASQQGAATMQNLNMQQGQLRAQEHTAAQSALGGALNQQRVADLQSTGMSYQNALSQAQMEAQQNQTQAGLQMSQNQLNQAGAISMFGMGQNAAMADIQGRQQYAANMLQGRAQNIGIAEGALAQQQIQAQNSQYAMGLGIKAGSSVAGAMSGGMGGGGGDVTTAPSAAPSYSYDSKAGIYRGNPYG